ncbi:vWA domain-containing protein [Aliikangiella sp. IMCC44359]|uniref:vWA domain-containing protein n=1 Tax=Aliikangiella sp. IMCC44359 TaxID=3459125 RepID=UPI00403A999D
MKRKNRSLVTIISLFIITAISVVVSANIDRISQITVLNPPQISAPQMAYPGNKRAKVELVFVLDTTASMGGLITAAKEKIWSIASTMANTQPAPEISIGLVAYRDRGDAYVTKIIPLSANLDSVYAALLDLKAQGGGDAPESVNAALYEAVNSIQWSKDPNSYQAIFLVGDAPGHNSYPDDVPYLISLTKASEKGIIVNTIQVGENQQTTAMWQTIAQLGSGESFQVKQSGSSLAIATPFDKAIVKASKKLDDSKLYFGSKEEKEKNKLRQETTEKLYAHSSSAALARRAKYNLTEAGKNNFAGKNELVNVLGSRSLSLDSIDEDQLPEEMQSMKPKEKEAYIQEKILQRKSNQKELKELAEKRDNYIKAQLGNIKDVNHSLDKQLLTTLKKQAEKKGLDYSNAESSY